MYRYVLCLTIRCLNLAPLFQFKYGNSGQSFDFNVTVGNNSFLVLKLHFQIRYQTTYLLSGHAEDDYHVTGYRSTGRCETGPPGGRYSATRVAGMLGDVAAVLSRILAIVANDSDVKADKAFNTDGAVIKNGKD